MIAPWQEFSGEFIANCSTIVEQSTKGNDLDDRSANSTAGEFLRALGPFDLLQHSDASLFRSASELDRVFLLPNEHAKGLCFFGAQGQGVSATGSGNTTLRALRSCLGEALERRVHRNNAVAKELTIAHEDRVPLEYPSEFQLHWLSHQQGCSPSRYSGNNDWLLAKSLARQQFLQLPTSFVFRAGAISGATVLTSETTGCATGPDRETAICTALLELIERDSVAMWWYGGREACRLQLNGPDYFTLMSARTLLRRNSTRPVWLNILHNDIGVAVVVAVSADNNGDHVVAGFSAHLDILTAAISALEEVSQMELGLQLVMMKLEQEGESQLNPVDLRQLERAHALSVESYPELMPGRTKMLSSTADWRDASKVNEELVSRLQASGFEPFIVDVNLGDVQVPYVRAVIPGFESIDFARRSTRLRRCVSDLGRDEQAVAARPSLT